jgi:hypothetical protein
VNGQGRSPGGQQGFKVGTVELENRWGAWRREPFTHLSPLHVSVYAKT